MSLITSILTQGSNHYQTSSEQANALGTDFFSPGIVGTLTNTVGFAPMTGGYSLSVSGAVITIGTGIGYISATPSGQGAQLIRVYNTTNITNTTSNNTTGSTVYDYYYLAVDPIAAINPAADGTGVASIVVSRSTSSSTDNGGATPSYYTLIGIVSVPNGFVSLASGNLIDRRTQAAPKSTTASSTDGWLATNETWTYGANAGNKEYTVTVSGDKTGKYSPGMKVRVPRAVTPPTQAMSFTSGSSQYASKASPTGISYANAFTTEAWVYIPSYATIMIMSAGTMPNNGFQFYLNSTGQVCVVGFLNSSNNRNRISYQSIPLNKWTHVAAAVNAATGTISIYINGTSVPTINSDAGTTTTLTAPTGSLYLGRDSNGNYFNGYISEARLWSGAQTSSNIQGNMSINLVGSETNLIALYQGNGAWTDATTNANTLTAVGATFATANPFNALEYGVIAAVAYSSPNSTITIQTGDYCSLPNQTFGVVSYSLMEEPFGLPGGLGRNRTLVSVPYINTLTTTNTSLATIPGAAVVMATIPVNRRVRVKLVSAITHSATGASLHVGIFRGSVAVANTIAGGNNRTVTGTVPQSFMTEGYDFLSGQQTYTFSFFGDAGTSTLGQLEFSAAYPSCQFTVELTD